MPLGVQEGESRRPGAPADSRAGLSVARRGQRPVVTAVSRTIDAPLEDVWDALVDVRTYPSWLIGAQKIRAVDDDWPEPGSAFHHTVGIGGPLTLSDRTRCREIDPPHRLVLDIKARPLVHGTVT